MFETIKNYLKVASKEGINFFFAHDPTTGKASVTLFMTYISFWLACISLIALHFNSTLLSATGMSFLFTGMFTIFYMIRKINKAKFDLDDKEIELSNGEENDK